MFTADPPHVSIRTLTASQTSDWIVNSKVTIDDLKAWAKDAALPE